MPELMVYLSGEIVPESKARISLFDRGFIFGDAVYDVARTFGHQPFKVREHIERLYGSLHYVQIEPGLSMEEMEEKTLDLLERNRPAFESGRDYRICHWISRGVNPASYSIEECGPATVSIFNYPILAERWADKYEEGLRSREIGERMNLKPSAVDMALSRCRKALEHCMEKRRGAPAHG